MTELVTIFFSVCLINNLVLDALTGVFPAVAVSRKIETARGLAVVMTWVLVAAALISHLLQRFVLVPAGLEYLQIVSLVVCISLTVLTGEAVLRRLWPAAHDRYAIFLPLALLNSAVLGVALLTIRHQYGLAGSLVFGLGAGAGFGLVLMILAALEQRIVTAAVPAPFRGIAILLVTLGILSMAFAGFNGLVKI